MVLFGLEAFFIEAPWSKRKYYFDREVIENILFPLGEPPIPRSARLSGAVSFLPEQRFRCWKASNLSPLSREALSMDSGVSRDVLNSSSGISSRIWLKPVSATTPVFNNLSLFSSFSAEFVCAFRGASVSNFWRRPRHYDAFFHHLKAGPRFSTWSMIFRFLPSTQIMCVTFCSQASQKDS